MTHDDPRARGTPVGVWIRGIAVSGFLVLAAASPAEGQLSPGPLARPHATLEGATNCVKCHGLKGANSPLSQGCLQCHKEIAWLVQQQRGLHAREVRVARKTCASCHPDHAGADFEMVEWSEGSPARFDHRKAGWVLDGKHADAKCEACHTATLRVGRAAALSVRKRGAGWVGLERDCLSCHESDDVHEGALATTCESCHDTRRWDAAPKFDHDKADYRLDGKHADVACNACHLTPRLKTRTNADGERLPLFKPVAYKECSSCHDDPHKGRLSSRCSECHTTTGFAVIDKREFNHALTRYPLKGDHARVACTSCHGPDLSRKQLPFATCASCHADAHDGQATLGGKSADCAACHGVDGFAPSTFTAAQHRATAYPLEGKHQGVKCAACHDARVAPASRTVAAGGLARSSKVVRLRPAAARCADCHADSHGAQALATVAPETCESCHAVSGFAPSTFTRAAHARTRLALEGRHATVSCTACHGARRPGLPPWPSATLASLGKGKVKLAGVDPSCTACHVDPHGARYSRPGGAAGDGTCRGCHGADSFTPSLVDVRLHATYALALDGAHRAVPCMACHAELAERPRKGTSTLLGGASAVAALPFASTARRCSSCHETPHGAQFASRNEGDDCATCHGVAAFAPASTFNHERTAFPLQGAHAGVTCAACHASEPIPGGAPGATRVTYRPVSTQCESCHGKASARRASVSGARGAVEARREPLRAVGR